MSLSIIVNLMTSITTTTIIKKGQSFCDKVGARFTEPRRYVLQILSKTKNPMTAYEVLNSLQQYLNNPKPPTAYRAIDFWVSHGFVHRIESLNAYKICNADHNHDGSQFMVCDDCGDVSEAHLCHLPDVLKSKAQGSNFKVNHWSIELHGQCAKCIGRV